MYNSIGFYTNTFILISLYTVSSINFHQPIIIYFIPTTYLTSIIIINIQNE